MKSYFVYILSSYSRTLYISITNNLQRRVCEHKQKLVQGFSSKYNIDRLVYFETFHDVNEALRREKQLKNWARAKKENLIERANPGWEDLSEAL